MEKDKIEVTINTYDNIVKEYVDYYNSKELKNSVQFQREIDYIVSNLEDNASILDIGTAIGDYPKFLTEKCSKHFNVTGIDSSKNMLEIAKNNAPKAEFKLMDMRNLEFEAENFDSIIAFAVLIHVDDETCLKILSEFNRILKKNGLIAINVMEWDQGEEKQIYIDEPFNPEYKTFFNRYTKEFFREYFEKNGYKIEKIYDNKLFNSGAVGEDLEDVNEFTIIVKKHI